VARSFIVYQGEDELPEFDLTDPESNVHVIFEEVEAGGRAYRGESNSSSIPMRDQRGETGNEEDLPGSLTHVSLSRGSRWVWMDGPDGSEVIMASGRIGPKSYSRGRQKSDRAREVIVEAADRNEELTDIIVDDWVRPEEEDYERVEALRVDYLSGTPRATTNIADTYIAASNGVTLPAKTYDGTDPKGVLDEIATIANKNYFVTVDDELWYDTYDSLTYPAGLRISDRPDEWNFAAGCPDDVSAGETLGGIGSGDPDNYLAQVVTGPRAERAELVTEADAAPGQTIIVIAGHVHNADPEIGVWDDAGNTYILAAEHRKNISGDQPRVSIWYSNVEFALPAGSSIYFEVDVGSSLVTTLETDDKAISAYVFNGTVAAAAESGGNSGFDAAPLEIVGGGDLIVTGLISKADTGDTFTEDGDWTAFTQANSANGASSCVVVGGFRVGDAGGETWSGTISQDRDWATIGAIFTIGIAPGGAGLATFGPKWDVGDASREDGLELVSGLRLYYGQDGAYVTADDPTTEAEYWHAQRSFYTSDPAIDTAPKAQVMADAILQRLKFEDRTYSCSIGPLNEDQVGCIKYGQLLYIKARAIPDADDQFRPRRIAQLRWTTPRPGVFFARMQLDRPLKEVPYGVGPKTAHDALELHKEGDSHPASAIVITDAGGYFTGTDVEAALQELGLSGGGAHDHDATDVTSTVVAHGTVGAAEDFDFTDGTDHEGTLDQNLTVTLSGATNGEAAWMTLKLTQDGTGTNTIDLPASVVNASDVEGAFDTAANAVNVISVFTYDGGSTWYAFLAGGSGAAIDDGTAVAQRLRWDGSDWSGSSLIWKPVTTYDGTNWLPAVDGDGNAIVTEA
jgi:hypothetical protein